VKRNKHNIGDKHGCSDYQVSFQEYLDGTLSKQESLELFLHVRECNDCHTQLEDVKSVFQLLDDLPVQTAPEDFDNKILASVPYQAYKDMEPLRRERVPVYLAEESLPAIVRSPIIRGIGFAVALVCGSGLIANRLPDWTVAVAIMGLLPEAIVRLQSLGRWFTLAAQKSES